jgi:hypothetical protein
MTFSLVVEDGSMVAGANSYVTVQEADDYIIQNFHAWPAWNALNLPTKQQLLAWACRYVDQRATWYGEQTSSAWALGLRFSPPIANWIIPPGPLPGFGGPLPPIATLQVNAGPANIRMISASPSSGVMVPGQSIIVTILFNTTVVVAGGTPSLTLNDGGVANYTSGSGTTALAFTYIVGAEDYTTSLAPASSNALNLNGATIKDLGGNNASLTTPSVFGGSTWPWLQSMRWPRLGVFDVDNNPIPPNVIPYQLKQACMEMARYLIAQDRSLERPQDGLKELKVDVITLVFQPGYTLPIVPGEIGYIIRNLGTIGSGRTNFAKIVRA